MTEKAAGRPRVQKPPAMMEARLLSWGPRGRANGQAVEGERQVLVDRGIPGERVVVQVRRGRGPRQGFVDTVLESASTRVAPPCRHYLEGCGGCQWQHMQYDAQVAAKVDAVNGEMASCGVDARVTQAHPMDTPWRYRRTAAIAIGWEAGFRPRGRRGIVEVRDCPISHPLIGRCADRLNDLLRAGKLPNYHGKVFLDCAVVGSDASPALQVVLQGIQGLTLEDNPELPEVARTVAGIEGVIAVAYRHRSGDARPLVGDLFNGIEVEGQRMYLPAGSFFQTNLEMLPKIIGCMRSMLENAQEWTVADIYGGVGTFGLALAPLVQHMMLIELDPLAVAAAERTATERGLENVSFVSRHAEHALEALPRLNAAIVDPPRSGLGDLVVAGLLKNEPSHIFYVSCAPRSLARDVRLLLDGGFQMRSLEVFDFYPQTYHVESLAVLER